jgi:hypothetical protein
MEYMMKKTLVALTVFSSLLGQSSAMAAETITTFHRKAAGVKSEDGTFLARSTKGGFVVKVPIQFNDVTMTTPGTKSGDVVVHAIGANSADGFKFTAMATERTKTMRDSDMKQSLVSLGKEQGVSAAITAETRNGVEMFSAHFADHPQPAYVLVAKTDARYYTLTCEYPAKHVAAGKRLCEAYLRSFEIEEAPR